MRLRFLFITAYGVLSYGLGIFVGKEEPTTFPITVIAPYDTTEASIITMAGLKFVCYPLD